MQFETIQGIIDFAIEKEQEAVDFYAELAEKVEDSTVAAELLKMKAEEERHRDTLKNMPIAFVANEAKEVQNLKIADYTMEVAATPDMTFRDAVNVAMHRELMAMQLYQEAANFVTDPTIKTLFNNLASEEARHKLYFETLWDEQILTED